MEVDPKSVDPLELSRKNPRLSAVIPVTPVQKIVILSAVAVAVVMTFLFPWQMAKLFILISTLFYLAFTVYKFLLVRFSVTRATEIRLTEEEITALLPMDLPVYSILVPMYREPESVAHVVSAIAGLDYPADKKDVQLLLEEDDMDTRNAVSKLNLPSGFRVTIVPESFPRTKPKACNIGLSLAKGEYLVIYDAEDKPEPDQLRKAVAAFAMVDPEVICLQSRLNFYNPRQNFLTRWFTAEYSAWFDLSLPGLCAIGAVIPLGGTSNHFITVYLRELMGWDAYNVTEDCDLGVRIYRAGYSTRMLCTTTWEEACSSWKFWIRQRTRWLKGYIQTYMVHMRHPLRLARELGFANFCQFQALVGGIVFSFLINPVFWILAIMWFIFRLEVFTSLFPPFVFAGGALCLFVGNFGFVYIGAIGCYKRGYFDLVKYALTAPLYWMLMSYSGWRAVIQFFVKPFYWEKTSHGLFKQK